MAAYCRVSTLEQKKKGYGIAIQVRDINTYANTFNLTIGGYYVDEAQSGICDERKALKRLMTHCRGGKIGAIIVSSLDRLSRDLRLTENLLFTLQELGVQVHIADMPNYDGSNRKDVLIRQIKAAIAEENRKEIIERLKKGREERIRKGLMAGGTLPYGYQRNGRNIEKHPREVEIVRIIFALQAENQSGRQIACRLNEKGYQRRNGQPWTQRQIWSILSRKELYSNGIIRYGQAQGENEYLIILG